MDTSQKVIPITRREIGSGLAFAEEHDLQRLSRWAADGWKIVKINGLFMVLEQAPPQQLVFALDYQDTPDSEYYEVCATAGWVHVISVEQRIHLFCAVPGTPSIFSAADATVKYERAARMLAAPALWSSLVFAIGICAVLLSGTPWLVSQFDRGVLELVSVILLTLGGTMVIFTALPWCAYRMRVSGYSLRWNRVIFAIVFALCGACLGYFFGMTIANVGW